MPVTTGVAMAKCSARERSEAARRRPPQALRPDDEHGAAGDRDAGAVAARRCTAGTECATDRWHRGRRHRRDQPDARTTPRSTSPPSAPRSNWQSFNVGSQQSVTFNQPSASAVTLNRVTGPDPSQIAGRIDANGQVVLVNQSGVTFYKGAQVNTNGLMVAAIGITTQELHGRQAWCSTSRAIRTRAIDNQGTITVKQAGLAALVAPQVANSGVINAKLGHVVLAGAKTATLDLYGDGLLSLDVTNQVTQAPRRRERQRRRPRW